MRPRRAECVEAAAQARKSVKVNMNPTNRHRDNPLDDVLTLREVAQLYRVHIRTARRAIDARRNPLEARKSPNTARGVWLVTRASCERRWGRGSIGAKARRRRCV